MDQNFIIIQGSIDNKIFLLTIFLLIKKRNRLFNYFDNEQDVNESSEHHMKKWFFIGIICICSSLRTKVTFMRLGLCS